MEKYSIENEIVKALVRFSYGRISFHDATAKAKEVAPHFDLHNKMLAHKGLNWYVKELIKSM